jgi:two-component system, NtrC family, response regulator HydG
MKNILIVDDEEEAIDVLSDFLSDLGYSVKTALNGEEALEVLINKKVDIVLLDLRMPRIDGEGILKIIRDLNPATAVIVMTGYSDGGRTKEKIMKYNVKHYLEKPLDLTVIEKLVTSITEEQRKAEENGAT